MSVIEASVNSHYCQQPLTCSLFFCFDSLLLLLLAELSCSLKLKYYQIRRDNNESAIEWWCFTAATSWQSVRLPACHHLQKSGKRVWNVETLPPWVLLRFFSTSSPPHFYSAAAFNHLTEFKHLKLHCCAEFYVGFANGRGHFLREMLQTYTHDWCFIPYSGGGR